jgi:hypothetical protein
MSFSLLFLPLPIARLDERDGLVERMREQIEDDARLREKSGGAAPRNIGRCKHTRQGLR